MAKRGARIFVACCALLILMTSAVAAQGPPPGAAFATEDVVYRLPPVTEESPPPEIEQTAAVQVEIIPTPDPKMNQEVVVEEAPPPPPKIWEASLEFGLNGSTGNSEVFTMRFGTHAKRCVPTDTLSLDLTYSRGTRDGVEAENRGFFDAKNEWLIKDSPWSPFVKSTLEYDEFRAFDVRVVANAGLGYQLIKNDVTTFITRMGSGFSQEIGGPDDAIVPEGLAGADFEHKLSEFQKIIASTEYYPDIGDIQDFRAVNKAAWEMLVDPRWNTSLKLSANHRYDSTPHGLKKNDLDYTLLVMWKY